MNRCMNEVYLTLDTNVLRPTHHVLQQKFKPSPTLIPLTLSLAAGRKHLSILSATMYNEAECQFYVLRLNVGLDTLQYISSISLLVILCDLILCQCSVQ